MEKRKGESTTNNGSKTNRRIAKGDRVAGEVANHLKEELAGVQRGGEEEHHSSREQVQESWRAGSSLLNYQCGAVNKRAVDQQGENFDWKCCSAEQCMKQTNIRTMLHKRRGAKLIKAQESF